MPAVMLFSFALGLLAPEVFRDEIRKGPVIGAVTLLFVGILIMLVQYYRGDS